MISSPFSSPRNRAGTATRPLLSTECSNRPKNIVPSPRRAAWIIHSYPPTSPLFPTFCHFFHISHIIEAFESFASEIHSLLRAWFPEKQCQKKPPRRQGAKN